MSRTKSEEQSLETETVVKGKKKRKVNGKIWSLVKPAMIRREKINWFWK